MDFDHLRRSIPDGWRALRVGLFGAGSAVIGAAFLVHARHAKGGGAVVLTDVRLLAWREQAGSGQRIEVADTNGWAPPGWGQRSWIGFGSHGQTVEVGRHVRPAWRKALAGEMGRALRMISVAPGADQEVVV
ncbi:MAG: DUF2244 domain-containing protein [Ottowia sp.]|nr:DUF2244 domain-containing protein [Ottowia sp.]